MSMEEVILGPVLSDKDKARDKFVKTGRGRRQDSNTKGIRREKDSDVSRWEIEASLRRDVRHGGDEPLRIESQE